MAERRGKGEDSIYFENDGACRDATRHRRCPGRWRAEVCLGCGPGGKRLRRRVSGPTKAAVQDALRELRAEAAIGITKAPPASYTVRRAADDWLASGLPGRSAKTIRKNKDVLEPILAVIGAARLRELDAAAVDRALQAMARAYRRPRSAWATSRSNALSGSPPPETWSAGTSPNCPILRWGSPAGPAGP